MISRDELTRVNTMVGQQLEAGTPLTLRLDEPTTPQILVASLEPLNYRPLTDFNGRRVGKFPISALIWTLDDRSEVDDVYCVVTEPPLEAMRGYSIGRDLLRDMISLTDRI